MKGISFLISVHIISFFSTPGAKSKTKNMKGEKGVPEVEDVQVSAEKESDNKTSTAAPESQSRPESGSNNENGNEDAEIHCQ